MNRFYQRLFGVLILLTGLSTQLAAQNVGISNAAITPDAQAILELRSSDKGVLLPRMTTAQATTLAASLNVFDDGMTVYDTDLKQYKYWNGTTLTWNILATSASVTGSTLDDAYDAGGTGSGRTITGDAGPVVISGTGGTIALETDGDIQLTEDDAWIGSSPTLQRLRFDDNSSGRIHVEAADLTMDTDRWIGIDGSNPRIEFEGGSGRVNVQNADIEIDDDAWIGLNASNPRIEFDNANDRLDMRASDIEIDSDKWVGIGSTVERILYEGTDNEINILGIDGVGINTDAPNAKLEVWDGPSTDPFLVKLVKNSNVASDLSGIGFGSEQSFHHVKSGIVHEREATNGVGKLHFLVDNVQDANDVSLAESRMTIDENGLVGIGEANPAEELHVAGDIRSTALAGGGNVQADANGNLVISNDLPGSDDSYIHNQNAAYQTANFQISGDGEMDGGLTVGAGMTIDDNNTNIGTVANGAIAFGNSSGEGIGSKRSAGGNQYGLDFYTNSANRIAIQQDGDVGIGTTTPAYKLDVNGNLRTEGDIWLGTDAANGPRLFLTNSTTTHSISAEGWWTVFKSHTNEGWIFENESAVDQMVYAADDYLYVKDNLGVGTTAPGQKLDVRGVMRSEGSYRVDVDGNNGSGPRVAFGTTANEYAYMNLGAYNSINNLETTDRDFRLGSNAHLNALYLQASTGEVGVGTNDPDHRLEVNGQIEIQYDNQDNKLRFHDPGNTWFSMGTDQSDAGSFKINYGGNIGDANHFTMETSGDVGIGTTAPSHKLHVAGANDAIRIEGTGPTYGYYGKLNFGDANYVYLEETNDDNLTVEASGGTRIGNQGTYTRDVFHGTFTVGNDNANNCPACIWSGWGGNVLEIQVSWANLGIPDGTNKTVLLMADGNNNTYTDIWNVALQQMFSNRMDILIDRTDGGGWGLTSLRIHYIVMNND